MADNTLGLIIAAVSVVTSGLQQVFCRELQKNNKLSGVELLSVTAPAQVLPFDQSLIVFPIFVRSCCRKQGIQSGAGSFRKLCYHDS
jgi:hypothetical protein